MTVLIPLTVAVCWTLARYWIDPHGLANADGQPPPIELVVLLHIVAGLCAVAWALVLRRWVRRDITLRSAARQFLGARST